MKARNRALVIVLAMLLVACAGAPTTSTPGASPAAAAPSTAPASATANAGPITLNVWVRDYTLNQDSPFTSAKRAFEAKHPNVTVNLLGLPNDPLYQKLLLSKSGGDKPDVFQMDTIWLGQMAEEHLATNLDSHYANFSQATDIPDNYLASSKWKGSYYGVWLNSDVRLFDWNKDVFRKAGLDPEKPPATWDEMISMAQTIQSKLSGVSGVCFPAKAEETTADRWYPFLWMGGGDILSTDFSQATFNSAAGVQALQLYVDLVHKYKVTPISVLNQSGDDVENALFAGKCAMDIVGVGTGQADVAIDAQATYAQHYGAAQIPLCAGCQASSGAGGWLLGVNDASPQKDLAFEFIDMATATDNVMAFDVEQQRVPVRKSGLALTDAFKGVAYFDQIAQAAKVAHFAPWIPQYPKLLETIYTAIQIAVQGDVPVKDALDAGVAAANKILKP